ncbi:hypothetical protein LCGC14_2917350, partial [marine sediment metagenome]
ATVTWSPNTSASALPNKERGNFFLTSLSQQVGGVEPPTNDLQDRCSAN